MRARLPGALLLSFALAASVEAALPPSFNDEQVVLISGPTALAFTPDGRLLIAQQSGVLRVYQGGALLASPALAIPGTEICTNSERGLLGVAVDPDFAANNYVYLFYTFRNGAPSCSGSAVPKNRVSRFVLPPGSVIAPASEVVLVDGMPSPAGNHNAGDVHFGRDGYLYASIGDGGCDYAGGGCAGSNDAARDEHTLTGKILRITRDGGIPADNPFQGPGTARCNVTGGTTPGNRCQETFAWGLRNPFRMAFDPNAAGTRFFVNDVGQSAREEIDLGQAGADYGWNCREGTVVNSTTGECSPTPAGMVDPIYEYGRPGTVPGTTASNCGSITGGAFVPNGLWPGFDGVYLFADYVCGWIFRLSAAPPYAAADFATMLGSSSAVHLRFGPRGAGQALYYTTYALGGQVHRIYYSESGNQQPSAVGSATPSSGPVPLEVTLSAAGSSDPDAGDTLTFFWSFGDGTPDVQTTATTVLHTYTAAGGYSATLRARDNHFAFSDPVTVQVAVGTAPPVPTIVSPAAGDRFRVGELVTLIGSATDEGAPLPDDALSWVVILHHGAHTHPFLGPVTGNNVVFTAPAPEDFAAAANSFLEVRLTATDPGGLQATVTGDFLPRLVDVTFATSPTGLTLTVNGAPVTAPVTVKSWDGYVLDVSAAAQVGPGGVSYVFATWSDGGAAGHAIVTPASAATYTATFGPVQVSAGFEMAHGAHLTRSLAALPGPVPRIDLFRMAQKPYASYEVVVDATAGDVTPAVLARTSADGQTVVQPSAAVGTGAARRLRWQNAQASPVGDEYIRVQAGACSTGCGADDVYRLRAWETTYAIPRFNNAGGQVTVLVVQNPTSELVAGRAWFWSTSGTLLGSHVLGLAERSTLVLDTRTVPGVADTAGSITVTADAPYAALRGKTVAVDLAGGVASDTPMLPRPR